MMPEENKIKKDMSSALYKIKDTVLNFLIPLIAIVGSVLLGILYIMPSFKSLPIKKAELESKMIVKNTLDDKVSDLRRLVDMKSTFDENSEIVNKVLVAEPEVPRLLDQATQITEKAGMSLERLGYSYSSKGESETGLDTVTVSMGVNSSFEQLILFMELVENSARYVSIPSFRYSVSDKITEDKGAVSSTFSLDSPYLFVKSSAVTDDPIKIDVTSSDFINFMDMLKGLDYYDFINQNIQAEEEKPGEDKENEEATETTPKTNTTTSGTQPANPVADTPVLPSGTAGGGSVFPIR